VPVALASPRLSPVWLLPLTLWVDADAWSDESPVRIAGVLVIAATAVAVGLDTGRRARSAAPALTADAFRSNLSV
jgi:hypothetical protein